MSTGEFVVSDNEIWNFDTNDDFIWLPEISSNGLARFTANFESFRYVADKE